MNSLRESLKECKAILRRVPFLNSLIRNSKYIFAFGVFAWILGGLIPDTAHFAVTLFSSLGRILVFVGLFFTLVRGGADRFIMITSVILSAGALIIIIVELAATIYFASLESYLFLLFFLIVAVNSGKYIKNKRLYGDPKKDDYLETFIDTLSQPSVESEPIVQVETLSRKAPPIPPEAPELQSSEAAPAEVPATPTQTTSPRQSTLQRMPSIGAAPTLERAPRVRLKPKK